MLNARVRISKVKSSLSGLLVTAAVGVHPAQAQDMTAGLILEKMRPEERFAYVNGIVTGMAYARFRKDTIAAGSKDERGMKCIYEWFHKGDGGTYAMLDATFRKNSQHTPSVIIATLLKKECGE
jgi:hypothetical protein